ncbi:MAG: peptide chain release factor N(5)-glutamine methyltransferase [Pyrinomonadaceae bacterium]|nr:peptide chain release factor N(5)-glutamine methyltransferase [Pyrinomonadaceae bacterium]
MSATKSIFQALRDANEKLKLGGNDDAIFEANLLLRNVLKRDKSFLIAHGNDYFLTDDEQTKYLQFIERRANNEPIQYITGVQEFCGFDFEVNESVLIPRPETEILVEASLEILRDAENAIFCDVGTGSGCVAISILKNLQNSKAAAIDISPSALEVARRNAEKLGVANRIEFIESNVFGNLNLETQSAKFDLIASNPPYISTKDAPTLHAQVIEYEPNNALFAGVDGFDVIRKLLKDAPRFLKTNGFLLFEIGYDQSEKVLDLIDKDIWNLREIRRDWQNIGRCVLLQSSPKSKVQESQVLLANR